MRKRPFGITRREIPVIGQGTWQIHNAGRRTSVAALQRGIELGMTHIDTAELYDGAEAIVAEAIAGRRDDVFVVSKVLPQNASRRATVSACEQSLQRLRIERLDCYLLHWRGKHPLTETIAAFEELEQKGKIRAWGLSNFDVPDLEEVVGIAGEGRIACNQVLYHLQERAIEHAVLPWCEKHGVALVGYSPFGQGDFPRPHSPGGNVLDAIAEIARRDAAPGGPRFPRPASAAFCDPQGEPSRSMPWRTQEPASSSSRRKSSRESTRRFRSVPPPRRLPTN